MKMNINKLLYFFIPKSNYSTGNVFVRNKGLPVCSNCVHFIEHKNNYPYDPIPSNERYGRCKLFGEVDLVTGTIEHDLAKICRLTESQCGKSGSKFTDKSNVDFFEILM